MDLKPAEYVHTPRAFGGAHAVKLYGRTVFRSNGIHTVKALVDDLNAVLGDTKSIRRYQEEQRNAKSAGNQA